MPFGAVDGVSRQTHVETLLTPSISAGSQMWRARRAPLCFTAPHTPTGTTACLPPSPLSLLSFSVCAVKAGPAWRSEECVLCASSSYSACLALGKGSDQCFSSAKSQLAPSGCQVKFPDSPPRHDIWAFQSPALPFSASVRQTPGRRAWEPARYALPAMAGVNN